MKVKYFFLFFLIGYKVFSQLPEGFVYAETIIPNLEVELRYYSTNNFVGKRIDGYLSDTLIITNETALALKKVQAELHLKNLSLRIYDGYRPQRAVNQFIFWARELNDTLNKRVFYPNVAKKDLFKEEYIASKSGHSKGSTVDLTIVDIITKMPLDMGSCYDFFGKESWVNYKGISEKQRANRQLLQKVMLKHGFRNYPKEWWHFTLRNEPFQDTYFDFVIK